MLDEATLELLPEAVCRRLQKVNTEALERIGRKIREIGKLSTADLQKLRSLQNYDAVDLQWELERVTEKNAREIAEILEACAKSAYADAEVLYSARGLEYIPYSENTVLRRYVEALKRQTVGEYINLTQHTAFCVWGKKGQTTAQYFAANRTKIPTTLSETYSRVIDEAVTAVHAGQIDYQSAMRQTMRAIADSGIRTVDYATGYSRRLDTAVRQNVLWGIKQCNQEVAKQVGEEVGADGYEITYHSNPRPTHAPMGGRMYAIGKAQTIGGVYYPPFDEVQGLLEEYNCLHMAIPVILGISEPTYSEEELARLKEEDESTFEFEGQKYTRYEASQIQRKLESAMRRQKDRANLAAAAGDDTMRREAQEKINLLVNKYAGLCKASGLPTKMERARVAGFHRVKSISEVEHAIKIRVPYEIGKISGEKPLSKDMQESLAKEYLNFTAKFGETAMTELMVRRYRNDSIWGSFNPNSKVVTLFGVGGDEGKAVMTKTALLAKKKGEWSTGAPFHAFRHELAHAWLEKMKETNPRYRETILRIEEIQKRVLEGLRPGDKSGIIEQKKNILSLYGLDDIAECDEFIAECIAEYLNGKPRSLAKEVVEILLHELKGES